MLYQVQQSTRSAAAAAAAAAAARSILGLCLVDRSMQHVHQGAESTQVL